MILLWNSAEMEIELTFVDDNSQDVVRRQADRTLARDMLAFIHRELTARGLSYGDIDGIGVFRGPGSFTGLRIGITVLNTWARAEHIPIVGAANEGWKETCLARLHEGMNDEVVLPEYGAPARTTKPRK